jgi:hypothetical protein
MEKLKEIFDNISYSAAYDPVTYKVTRVGPSLAFKDERYKLAIEESLALNIIEGKIRLSNCYVDLESNSLDLVEKQHIRKIDDILHRVIEKKWSKKKTSEIYLTYNKKNKLLKIELTSIYSGTKKVYSRNKRKVQWSGDTEMNFYITEYNDPHELIKNISFSLNELINKSYEIILENIPDKFSIYTKRLFKEYVIEIK